MARAQRNSDGSMGKTEEGETEENGDGVGFIARPRSTEKPRSSLPMLVRSRRWPRARLEDGGRSPTVRCRPLVLFTIFTELPLDPFFKLLSNLYGNSKISKNKSCSKLKVLQLCFNNNTQIMSTFWNTSLKSKGNTLRIYPFLNYFKFYMTTLKTPKTNFVHIDKLYTFPFRLNPKCA